MIQPIYLYGSEVLRRKAAEADLAKKDELNALIQDLKDTLTRADGCGLAVSDPLRIFASALDTVDSAK